MRSRSACHATSTSTRSLVFIGCLVGAFAPFGLAGCPAPEPPKVAPARPDTEEDARAAYEAAKKKEDVDALFAVASRYKRFPVAQQALRLAATRQLDVAVQAAMACDSGRAAGALATVAGHTSDDKQIDAMYDDAHDQVARERARCLVVKLDADIKRAESTWNYPAAFNRIRTEKEVEGSTLKTKRLEVLGRWTAFVDRSLRDIVSKKSVDLALGDRRANWEASIDAAQLPEDCAELLEKLKPVFVGVLLVFDAMKEGEAIEPAVPYWTFGSPKARLPTSPMSTEGPTLGMGVAFQAIAKGKLGSVSFLVAGKAEGDVLARLGSAKLLIPEEDARSYDTRAVLPETLIGMTVLAPISQGSDVLTPSVVVSDKLGTVMVQPVAKRGSKDFISTKRSELRGMSLQVGQKVQVKVGTVWKPGEVADVPEDDKVLVKIGGFESYVQLTDVRVKRSELPALPKEKEAKGGLLGL